MKNFRTYCYLLFLALPALCIGQEESPGTGQPQPIPPGPLMQTRAPDFAQWAMTITEKKPSSKAGEETDAAASNSGTQVVMYIVTTIKTGATKVRRLAHPGGQIWETWCTGNLQITLRPDAAGAVIYRGKQTDDGETLFNVDYSQSDFPEIAIVSLPNFLDIETAYGTKCLVFKAMVAPFRDAPLAETKAYIDLRTRLPVALRVAGSSPSERTYQFTNPPTEALTLPPAIKVLITADKRISQQGTGWRP